MSGVTTTVEWNGREAVDSFNRANVKSLTEGAILIQGKAVLLAPVDEGNLRSSITYAVVGRAEDFPDVAKSQGSSVLFGGRTITPGPGEAIIGTVAFYAPYVEFGTRYMRAQPFLLPAYRSAIPAILRLFRRNYQGVRFVF